jgi:membrane-associated protease RseP (regulator of RpoE activity)
MSGSVRWIPSSNTLTGPFWLRPTLPVVVVGALLCLGLANLVMRATWRSVDDGVYWASGAGGVVVGDIAPGTPAERADLRAGDALLTIDDRAIESVADVSEVLQGAAGGRALRYTVLRPGRTDPIDVRMTPHVDRPPALYFVLALVGTFTLLVGGAVRLRRPQDPATLHFFWLAVAFFGVLTFSFTGRFDRLDWIFYWSDVVSTLALPPLFLHFTLIFPDRPRRWGRTPFARRVVAAAYAPAFVLGVARVLALVWSARDPRLAAAIVGVLDRADEMMHSCLRLK